MAALTTEAVLVESVEFPDRSIVDVWNVKLSGEATDTFTAPGVASTAGAGILLKGLGEDPEMPALAVGRNAVQASITVGVGVVSGGVSTVTVTNSATPRRRNQVIICTLRRRSGINNASIDEAP